MQRFAFGRIAYTQTARKIISNHFSFSNANGFIIITNGKKIYNYYFACRTKARKILCSAFHSLIPTRFDHSQSGRLQVFLYPMGYSVSPSFFLTKTDIFTWMNHSQCYAIFYRCRDLFFGSSSVISNALLLFVHSALGNSIEKELNGVVK